MMKSSIICVAVAATIALVHADQHTAAKSAKECEFHYLNETSVIALTTAQRCEALVRFSKCLGAFGTDTAAENTLFNQNTESCEPYWQSLDAPVLRTARGNLEMTVDDAKDIKFHRHRRDTISVFEMNQKITGLLTEIQNLKNANAELKKEAEDQLKTNDDLEEELNGLINNAKSSLEGSIQSISKTVDDAATDNQNKFNKFDQDQKQANADLTKSIDDKSKELESSLTKKMDDKLKEVEGTVDTKLKPFEGTELALTSLKNTYHSNPKIPVFRWTQFHTYSNYYGWVDGNRNQGYGGVHPSTWTDGNGRADQMANDFKYLQRMFNRHGTANSYGATICSEVYGQRSSTTGGVCGAIFRIKNTGTKTVRWSPKLTMTSFRGWAESASISVNGNNLIGSRDCNRECRDYTVNIDIPANSQKDRISTVVFISTSSHPNGHYNEWRTTLLMFLDNALALPTNLEYVDDLDTVSGAWKK